VDQVLGDFWPAKGREATLRSNLICEIEGNRGLPRHRPPCAAQVGLFGWPTLINKRRDARFRIGLIG
jgi:hypothetical protein